MSAPSMSNIAAIIHDSPLDTPKKWQTLHNILVLQTLVQVALIACWQKQK